ncbi:hypothetical protein MP228_001438 [Amoeboaphelidium protococcarum]|nr:hypothetical protein MP228_001438 [Amoeboaphelidium protococcarum]
MNFASAGVWSSIKPQLSTYSLNVIKCLGFDQMTPVQASSIPLFLNHKDVVVEATTGSGKSLAFIVPIVEILLRRSDGFKESQVGAIVICPTRELARQIHQVLLAFVPSDDDSVDQVIKTRIRAQLLTGGCTVDEDLKYFHQVNPTILIATPGKLDQILKSGKVNTSQLEVLVLDEADRLLDMGFDKQVREIIARLPKQRRTGLFSATITDALQDLVKAGLRNPVKIVVKVQDKVSKQIQRTPSLLSIVYKVVEAHNYVSTLLGVLQQYKHQKVIVYFATCLCVEYFHRVLSIILPKDQNIFALHGKKDSQQRPKILSKYEQCTAGVLLCTDVAARGIDFEDVDVVVQYHTPQDPQAFLHRCGRTARSGKSGKAITFLMPHEDTFVEYLTLKKVPLVEDSTDYTFDTSLLDVNGLNFPSFYNSSLENSIGCSQLKLERLMHWNVLQDRALYDAQVRAFVSYLQSYKEHQLKFIFPFSKLPIDGVMCQFMLLAVPKSPEIRQWKQQHGDLQLFKSTVGDQYLDLVKYKEKAREKKRQQLLQAKTLKQNTQQSGAAQVKSQVKSSEPWSKQKQQKETRALKAEKREKKRKAILLKQMEQIDAQQSSGKTSLQQSNKVSTIKDQYLAESDDDLALDYKDYQKEKRRKC